MAKALPALPSLQIAPPRLRFCKISKVSPVVLLHRPTSCQLRVKSSFRGAVEIQWGQLMGSPSCPPRFVCLFEGGKGKGKQEPDDAAQGAARKALEKALGGKRVAFSKWEETQKREADFGGRGGGRGGRGWFGGRGWWEGFFDSSGDEEFWEETLQVTCAFLALCFVYVMIIAPQEVPKIMIFMPKIMIFIPKIMIFITAYPIVYILNTIIYYAWVLWEKAKSYAILSYSSVYGSRSPGPSREDGDKRKNGMNVLMDISDWDDLPVSTETRKNVNGSRSPGPSRKYGDKGENWMNVLMDMSDRDDLPVSTETRKNVNGSRSPGPSRKYVDKNWMNVLLGRSDWDDY